MSRKTDVLCNMPWYLNYKRLFSTNFWKFTLFHVKVTVQASLAFANVVITHKRERLLEEKTRFKASWIKSSNLNYIQIFIGTQMLFLLDCFLHFLYLSLPFSFKPLQETYNSPTISFPKRAVSFPWWQGYEHSYCLLPYTFKLQVLLVQ